MTERNSEYQKAVDTSDILYAAGNSLPLFYNSQYDLGKHLTVCEEKSSEYKPLLNEHFTLARMNISTKTITPPEINMNKPRRNFLFIKGINDEKK